MIEKPNRIENIQINLQLDKQKFDKHKDELGELLTYTPTVCSGDILNVKYNFNVEYYGNICKKLAAINEIMADPEVVISVSDDELNHGQSVIAETFRLVNELKEVCDERNASGRT